MNISIFHNMTSKLPLPGLLEGVANLIREDEKLAAFTASYRQTGSKTFKNEAPLFSVACLFEGGKGRSNVRPLTGLSLVDIDHGEHIEEMKKKAIADPHTLMSYITMSGNGLRVIFKYDIAPEFSGVPKDEAEVKKFETYYQQAFYAGNAYYEKLLGCKAGYAVQEPHPTERSCPRPRSVPSPRIRGRTFHGRRNLYRSRHLCQTEQGGEADAAHPDLLRHPHCAPVGESKHPVSERKS